MWLNVFNSHNPFAVQDTTDTSIFSGDHQSRIASGLSNFTKIKLATRYGVLRVKAIAFHGYDHPVVNSYIPSQNIIGDPSSLSDARLKTNLTEVTPEQCLNTLRQIKPTTYDRDDIGEYRLGLVADECEEALKNNGIEVDNVIGERRWQVDGETDMYKTLQYDRLVPLLIGAVNTLSARVEQLETKKRKTK